MQILSQLTTALLTSLVTQQVSAAGCKDGFFGKSCMFLCQCKTSNKCDSNGRCPNNDTCKVGYFGPGCQYEDVVMGKSSNTNPHYLVDHNDSSCNKIWDVRKVVLELKEWVPFSWFRLRLNNNNKTLLDFSVTLNDNAPCQNRRTYAVDPLTVDVTCDAPRLLKRLTIGGLITPYICSIYITPGRNVVVGRKAVEIKNPKMSISDATTVDGMTYTCLTFLETSNMQTFWRLTFTLQHYLLKVALYNTMDRLFQPRLNGFEFRTYDRSGSITYTYRDSTRHATATYEFAIPDRGLVSSVEFLFPATSAVGNKRLSICEVELFGEVLCPEGTYGLECEQQCSCNVKDICNTVTGICARGCEDITFGPNCKQSCSINCYQDQCYYRTGKCIQCSDGYTGDYCLQECANGTYGKSCAMNCSENCLGICDHHNGGCSCNQPYVGVRCEECRAGLYGPNCSEVCPGKCAEVGCDILTGMCLTCPGSRQGDYCEECPRGFYGPMCYKKCSTYCLNQTCGAETGNCSVCLNDYHGEQCLDKVTGLDWFWGLVTVLSVLSLSVLVTMILIFVLRGRCTDEEEASTESDGSSTHVEKRSSIESSAASTDGGDKPNSLLQSLKLWSIITKKDSTTTTVADDDVGTEVDFVDDTTSVVSTWVDRGDDERPVADDVENVLTEANDVKTDVN